MGTTKLLIASAVLVVLSGVLWWSNKHPDWGKDKKTEAESPAIVNVPAASIDGIDLQKKDGGKVTLDHKAGKWAISSPAAYPADQDVASGVASALASATADSVVEDKPADLAKYGLTAPSLSVTVHEKGGKRDQLTFGDDVPAGSLVYLLVAGSPKVYAAPTSFKTSLDKSLSDLRDKRLLTFDQNQLTRLQVASQQSLIEFGKNGQNEWTIVQPEPFRADSFQVEELLRKLTEAKMDLAAPPADADFAKGKPLATAKLTDNASAQTLEVRQTGADYFAKSSVVPGYFKLAADLGKQLEKPAADYRNKKLFDFGFTDPTKLEIQQGASTKTFLRSGNDWKAGVQTMDSAAVQSLIDKLRDLTATQFATAGFTAAAASVTVVSNEGKRTEKVEFGKTPDGYLARRANEPALYSLDAKTVNDILEEGGKIKPASSKK